MVRRDGVAVPARLHRVPLDRGHRLLVGRDATDRENLRTLLSEALLWSFAVAVAFALAGAAALRRALADRLRAASATAGAIAAGDLSRRVPLSAQRDEFDQLGASMNAMLDRIDQLMIGIKGVSDSIAHDLRTPIARARMRLENALLRAPDEESLRVAMETTVADLDGISRVFQALLRIAEAEAGARRAAFARFDLAAVLTDALGKPVQVDVVAGAAQDSIFRRDNHAREAAQQAAEQLIHADPEVRSLMAQFRTARIVPGSIKPIAADGGHPKASPP
jgi:signal transduction histidine kinase